jgi:hypothetical protein
MGIESIADSTDIHYIRIELDYKEFRFLVVPCHGPKSYIDTSNIYTTSDCMTIDVMDEKDIPTAKELLISHAAHEAEVLVKEGQRIIDGLKKLQLEGK